MCCRSTKIKTAYVYLPYGYDKTDSSTDEELTPSEEESEKYPNEYLRNKESYEEDDFIDFLDKMELNKITLYEDDDAYYILEKLDMAERDGYTEANLESVIYSMKNEDFETLVDGLSKSLKVEKNQKALDRYNATDVYERQLEWSEENNSAQ